MDNHLIQSLTQQDMNHVEGTWDLETRDMEEKSHSPLTIEGKNYVPQHHMTTKSTQTICAAHETKILQLKKNWCSYNKKVYNLEKLCSNNQAEIYSVPLSKAEKVAGYKIINNNLREEVTVLIQVQIRELGRT